MAGTQPERPMILGNCISCNGLMRVPVTTDVTHVARCPHCDARFPVQQLIASAIPAAEILEGEVAEDFTPVVDRVRAATPEGEKPRTKFDVPKQLHDGAKHRRRRRRRRSRGSDDQRQQDRSDRSSGESKNSGARSISSASMPRIDAEAVPIASTQSLAAAKTAGVEVVDEAASSSRRSRSSSSSQSSVRSSGGRPGIRRASAFDDEETSDDPFMEWVKIVTGGLIALPLAYLALMWIAGLDPFGLANQINKAAPILVPASLVDQESLQPPEEDGGLPIDESDSLPKPSVDPDEVRG